MCEGCSITAPVFEAVAEEYLSNQDVSFFTFDLSTKATVDQTRDLAQELGIEGIYNAQKHTGEVLFIDPVNKKVLETLVLETDKSKYRKLIAKLVQKS